jgi:hypothetical protein
MFVLDVGIYRQDGHLRMWDLAFTGAMALCAFWCWPRVIEFSNGLISQRSVFGGMKSILFSDLTGAKFDARQQCIIISSKSRAKIVHTPMHAGRQQFVRQLSLLTGTQVFGLTC